MNVQDFFSIVQLGVGIHAGTAILQLSGEFGVSPVERRIENIANWISQEKERGKSLEDQEDEIQIIRANLVVFKAQYNNLYQKTVNLNFAVGALLTFMLCFMSFIADTKIGELLGLAIVLLCVAPALFIFCYLWHKSSEALLPIKKMISEMEAQIRSPT